MFTNQHQLRFHVQLVCLTLAYIIAFGTFLPLRTVAFPSPDKILTRQSTPSPLADKPASSDGKSAALELTTDEGKQSKLKEKFKHLQVPLSFEANQGQAADEVKFLARGQGYNFFLTANETILSWNAGETVDRNQTAARSSGLPNAAKSKLDAKAKTKPKKVPSASLRMKFLGANESAELKGEDELEGKSNYFIDNDAAKWRTEVANYGRVRVRDVYPGIDVIYYGNRRQMEYDLVVAPGADLNAIRLEFSGARKLRIEAQGDILLTSKGGDIRMHAPNVYQESDGEKISIRGSFVRTGKNQVGFRVAEYDKSKPLVIDPVLTLAYSTLLGGSSSDGGYSIAVDSSGNAYVTGLTYSTNFPLKNAYQSTMSGTSIVRADEVFDAFVTKLSADGSSLIYSTYLGGSDNNDKGNGIAVDSAGNAYVMGLTNSKNFPTTANALQPASVQSNDSQFFVSKLNASGSSLLYSTYLGTTYSLYRSGVLGGIAVDAFGNAYVTGTTNSASFPLKNAFQSSFNGGNSAFITKIDTTASGADSLIYSSYIGSANGFTNSSEGQSVAADANGNAYITGYTGDPNFPTRNAFQPAIGKPGSGRQGLDAFLTKINTKASGDNSLVYSTFLGGSDNELEAYVAADQAGHAYVTGATDSTNFPTKNPFQAANRGFTNAFVTKLDTTASGANSLIYSTYLGGTARDSASSIALAANGDVYLAGFGRGLGVSSDFPQVNALPVAPNDRFSFVAKLNSSGSDLIYSSFFYGAIRGLALDAAGNAYVTGNTVEGANFPTTPGAFQTQPGGTSGDAFISKLSFTEAAVPTISSITPNRGGDTGFVTPTIKGTGFAPGAKVKLTRAGQTDIVGSPVTVRGDGRAITVRFDLHGAAQGAWDVSVMNPGGTTVTLSQGFTVEAGSSSDGSPSKVWVDLVGRNVIRPNQEGGFVIFYGNSGNTDALGVPITISGIPKDADVRLDFTLKATPLPTEFEQYRSDDISPVITTATEKVILLFVGVIPAGSSRSFRIIVTPHNQPLTAFTLKAAVGDPFFGSPLKKKPEDCYKAISIFILKKITDKLLKKIFPFEECAKAEAEAMAKISLAIVEAASKSGSGGLGPAEGIASMSGMLGPALRATIDCAEQAVGIIVPEIGVTIFILELIPDLYDAFKIGEDCSEAFSSQPERSLTVTIVRAIDPNDKVGSHGAGTPQYLTGDQPLRYAIFFENVATATAPAQTVVVNDQLDPAKFDLSTFSLGPIAFGSQLVNPPASLSQFNADVDLRPGKNLIARINAILDQTTGIITWRFDSIDPATNQPTTDPLAGFLPPNKTPPEGDATLIFTVMPKSGLVTGTQVRNRARIVFDTNAPIDTPEWLNTIDNSKPVSSVAALPANVPTSFPVTWSGTDAGAGIGTYTIFVSDNGSPFTPFFNGTTSPNGIYTGQSGHTYRFYSIARDLGGNIEPAKTNAEATTTVNSSVSGRVLMPDGFGLKNANVSITASNGSRRTVITNSFGFYQLADVLSGGTYTINVTSKRFRFASRVLQVTDNLTNVDFTGIE